MKLGDKIKVTKKYYRKIQQGNHGHTICTWVLKDIPEVEGIITGIRVISNGEMTNEGFLFSESIKVYKVAINLKSEFYIPIE